jgi:hypothetical protein
VLRFSISRLLPPCGSFKLSAMVFQASNYRFFTACAN